MTDHTPELTHRSAQAQPRSAVPSKSAQVLKLLARAGGATLADMMAATSWQPHTVRAHLTRLRKAGRMLERMERKSGPDAYHLVPTGNTDAPHAPNAKERA